MKILLAITK